MRLGIDDPEQWLETVDDEVFDRWQAYYAIEPFGGEQSLLATIAAELWLLCCSKYEDQKKMAKAIDELTTSFMPACWVGAAAEEQPEQSVHGQLEQLRQIMQKAFS